MSPFLLVPDWPSGSFPVGPGFETRESKTLGAELKIYAYYHPALPDSGPFGRRRTLSTNRYVLAGAANEVTLVGGDGRRYRFVLPSSCAEMHVLGGGGRGRGWRLEHTPSGFTEHMHLGGVARYVAHSADPAKFELATVEHGRSLTLYDYGEAGDGLLRRIDLLGGNSVDFEYEDADGTPRLTAIVDWDANTTRFEYGENGRLAAFVTWPNHSTWYRFTDLAGLVRQTVVDATSDSAGSVDIWSAQDGERRRYPRPMEIRDLGGANSQIADRTPPIFDLGNMEHRPQHHFTLRSFDPYEPPKRRPTRKKGMGLPTLFDDRPGLGGAHPFGAWFAQDLAEFVRTKQAEYEKALYPFGGSVTLRGPVAGAVYVFEDYALVRVVLPDGRFVGIEYTRLDSGVCRLKSMEDDEGRVTLFDAHRG